jgi:hypothetical protein
MPVRAARHAVFVAIVAYAFLGLGDAVAEPKNDGRLVGLTQISYGCPGPQRVGQQCERWSAFAHSRFALFRTPARGELIPNIPRIVTSDGRGSFSVVLTPGTYTIVPLVQPHSRGGTTLTARIRAGQTTRTMVRFLGSPIMV